MDKKGIVKLATKIENAVESYEDVEREGGAWWRGVDKLLRQINRTLPDHSRKAGIWVKVVAIDRLYAAMLYRGGDVEYGDVVDALHRKRARIDKALSSLGKTLSYGKVPEVVDLTALIAGFGDPEDASYWVFASKYLHFHKPGLFPILDSFAEKKLRGLLTKLDIPVKGEPGARYARFCYSILALRDALNEVTDGKFSLAQLDKYLYGDRDLKS